MIRLFENVSRAITECENAPAVNNKGRRTVGLLISVLRNLNEYEDEKKEYRKLSALKRAYRFFFMIQENFPLKAEIQKDLVKLMDANR